jgi:hypothetical protein
MSDVEEFTALPKLRHLKTIEEYEWDLLSVMMVDSQIPEDGTEDCRFFIKKLATFAKWEGQEYHRYILVQVSYDKITAYEQQKITLMELLTSNYDVGFLIDYQGNEIKRVYLRQISTLPKDYLPEVGAYHCVELRPENQHCED